MRACFSLDLIANWIFAADALERFANSHKSRATVDEDATIVKEMKHAMSVLTDEPESDQGVDEMSSEAVTAIEAEVEKERAVNDEDKEEESVDEQANLEETVQANDPSETATQPVMAGVELSRNPSETPSSEINLQFPPARSKRPRREDDQYIRSAGADVLLPLLIFTVVKSNPQKFVSNLKFIQRYRMPSRLTGEASYCLTNMLAVVAFLETTNLVGLGLSADRIMRYGCNNLYST